MNRYTIGTLIFVAAAGCAAAQITSSGSDVLGAHLNYGRGCVACHAPHSGASGNGQARNADPSSGNIALWGEDVKREATSRVTYEIEPVGSSCRLTVTHDQLREGANEQLYGGWPMILSTLKTLLETGESLDTPGSLMYAGTQA